MLFSNFSAFSGKLFAENLKQSQFSKSLESLACWMYVWKHLCYSLLLKTNSECFTRIHWRKGRHDNQIVSYYKICEKKLAEKSVTCGSCWKSLWIVRSFFLVKTWSPVVPAVQMPVVTSKWDLPLSRISWSNVMIECDSDQRLLNANGFCCERTGKILPVSHLVANLGFNHGFQSFNKVSVGS